MKRAPTLLCLLAAGTAGCSGCDDDPGETTDARDPDAGVSPDATVDAPLDAAGFYRSIPTTLNRNLDVLFVVDNSASMLAEQQQLAANFPQFVDVLSQIEGGFPDIHIGILSSDVGAAGQFGVPGCEAAGDDGNLLTGPPINTCAQQFGLQGAFISDIAQPDGARARNYTGDLAQLFTCMASLGTTGCGFEMHLESMYRALQPGKNPGFYRSGAHLAVVFVADEDDCSTELGVMFGDPNAGISSQLGPRTSFRCHEFGVRCENDPQPRALGPKTGCVPDPASPYMYEVQRYIDFLRTLKDPSSNTTVSVAGILGVFDPATGNLAVVPDIRTEDPNLPSVERSCIARDPGDPDDGATPPVRLQHFISAFPGHDALTSVCNDNLADAIIEIAGMLKTAIGNPCIDATLDDVDPNLPGLQPMCTVHDVVDPGGPGQMAIELPACETMFQTGGSCDAGSAATPCWCFLQDATSCPASAQNPSSLALGVTRGATPPPPPGSAVRLYCLAQP
ncbi:MAG: VWA domain-containing protein [Deltaproteobacteria bacterium]|nr:VWA domain-containing protein [Kofleriaceae bacterium]